MSERDLRGWTIDWDGSPMKDGEPPRDGLSCKDLRDACDEIDSLRSQLATAQATYLQFCKKHDEEMEKAIKALDTAESEARRYAEMYPQSSDGRNTFIILADRIATLKEIT